MSPSGLSRQDSARHGAMSLPGRGFISASWSAYRKTKGVPSPEVSAGSRNEEAIEASKAMVNCPSGWPCALTFPPDVAKKKKEKHATRTIVSRCWLVMGSSRGAPRLTVGPTGKLIRLIDETDDPGAVVDADRWCFAAPPVVERVAQGRQGQRFLGLSRHGFFAAGSHEPHGAIFEHQDGVAARDLPLAVRPIARERVSNLDGSEHAAG